MSKNEIIKSLLSQGRAFDEYFSGYKKERYPMLGAFGDEAFKQQEINDCLRMSPFKDLFEGLSDEIVYDIYLGYEAEKTQTKKWILNSEVRAKTFWLLGKHHPCSVKEIEEIMGRKDRNIYKAIEKFNEKKLVRKEEDPEDKRINLCHLTEIGTYFFYLAGRQHWFQDLFERQREIENTVIKIVHLYIDFSHNSAGEIVDHLAPLPEEAYPNNNKIIKEIKMVAFKLISSLGLEIQLPEIVDIRGRRNLLRINTTDEDKLALIFASFTYLEKLRTTADFPSIQQIKLIKTEDFFDTNMPDVSDDEGFMDEMETQDYVSKIMKEFKEKIPKNKES